MVKNVSLWQRIFSYELDDSAASFPFSARLARDNGWSRDYALRVIDEYKRFVYLAMVAGHEVTPSDEVDQAWHLHMTYTRDYWGPFTEVLGKPLHHGPTRGGASEDTRYEDNYTRTLGSYEREFGAPAPATIWPPAPVRFGKAPTFTRASKADYWMVPKRGVAMLAAGLAIMLAGWHGLVSGAMAQAAETGFLPSTWRDWVFWIACVAVLIVIALRPTAKKKNKRDGSGCGGSSCGAGCGGGCGGGD